jgi:hypothetical protein
MKNNITFKNWNSVIPEQYIYNKSGNIFNNNKSRLEIVLVQK